MTVSPPRSPGDGEEELEGGNLTRVVRDGDTVRRTAGAWTPAVHALLEHLDAAGYPAPRPLGFDEQGREVLSFVPGDAVHPELLDLAGLRRAGALIERYHRAQRSFVPPPDASWQELGRDPSGSDEVLCHNDLAPWNLIAGPTWTFIDWDLCAPGRRHWDLAWSMHSLVGLWEGTSSDSTATVERVHAFCDGARIERVERPAVLATVVERIEHLLSQMRTRAAAGDEVWQRQINEGHLEVWEAGRTHVGANLERWTAQLTTWR